MDFNQIQDIIRMVSKYKLSEFVLKEGEFKLVVRNQAAGGEQHSIAPVLVQAPAPTLIAAPASPAPVAAPAAEAPAPKADAAPAAAEDASKYVVIKSPMVGTFFRCPAPDKPAFVNVGDSVEPKSKVCVIEAMKLFNEIEAEVSGKIVKILVEDNKPVAYDQPLFWVDPS